MRGSGANKQELLNSIYEDYKEACDLVIEEIKKRKDGLPADDDLIRACAVFYVLGSQEAKTQGFTDIKLDDYISDFIPSIGAIIENSIASRPKNYIMPNHKLVNALAKHGNTHNEIAVTKLITKAPEIETKATLQYDENISLPKNFVQYDRAVLDAICSIYEAGNKAFTPAMVYRVMVAGNDKTTIRPKTLEEVTNSIEKLRKTTVKIDGSEELEKRNIPGVSKFIFDENILNLTAATVVINGAETKGYVFLNKPILHRYCELTKQIITVPLNLLETKTVNNTASVIVIKEYLIRQIELMKNNYRNNNKILYETIFSECGLTVKDRTTAKRFRDYIAKLLTEWINKEYIKAYKEYKKGNSAAGVEIIF